MRIKKKYIYILIILIFVFFAFMIYQTDLSNKKKEIKKNNIKIVKIDEPTSQELLIDLKKNSPNKKHPRLMATNEDFQKIKESLKSDIYLKQWFNELNIDANKILNEPVVQYKKSDGIRILPVSKTVLDRTITLSMMYKLSGDWRYAEAAWKELEQASKFYDWNPSHFLDTAEMATAFGIGYDWLYDYLRPRQKEVLQNALINKAFNPALKVYNNTTDIENIPIFWKNTTNNWNTITNSGLIVSALAIADESTKLEEISSEVLENAIKSIQKSLSSYSEDGGTEEGPGYWNYATKYIAYSLSSMDTSLRNDYGLSTMKGLSETGYFYIYMNGPGGLFNVGDSGGDNYNNLSQLLWFSNKYNNPVFGFPALKKYNAMNLIWYKKTLGYKNTKYLPLDKYFSRKETGIVTMRSSWSDSNSIFAGIHAGDNQASHGDLDIGSFVLDAQGVRWAEELGTDNYNLPGYFDMNRARWMYYRKGTEGQNSLVINPNKSVNQSIHAIGEIKSFKSKKNEASVVINMSKAYENAKLIQRKLSLVNNRKKVILEDKISLNEKSEIYWFMHTKANIGLSLNKQTAVLVREGKILYIHIKSPSTAKFSIMKAKPLQTSIINNQNGNENYRKLVIHLSNTKNTKLLVEFSITPIN
ncbi:heparinase II/III domain-containing protein [Niallia sp. 03091]|uniref:heparinase II/III domain-containing protein n=1 Tax=Niallia sp. 03091 TaxID=3458059 RepID=UPI0040442AB3